MTNPTSRVPVAASEDERLDLHEIGRMLRKAQDSHVPKLVGPCGEEVPLPESLFHLLRQVVDDLAQGQVVTLVSSNKELTTQQAANMLSMSRPYLVKLLERGEIPFAKTGAHRRILFTDLMEYKARRDTERRRGLAELTQLSQDIGLYDE